MVKFHITEFLGGQPINFLMLFRNFVQFLIGCMNVILIINLFKFGLHQFFFFVYIFNNPISRIDSGSEGIQDFVILIVGIFLRLSVAQGSSKCLTLPNTLEIRRTLMFHVPEALTPKTLRSCGNSVPTTFLSILLPFVLPLKLRRTGLPVVLVEVPSVGILYKLLELPCNVGIHLGIFIIGRLNCVTALCLQGHALALTQLSNP